MKKSQELLLCSLNDFYKKNTKYKKLLYEIINGKHKLSLRLIDWFVTAYARNNNIIYWILNNDNNIYYKLPNTTDNHKYKKFNLYLDYRAQLKSYAKLNFDSFRRHQRITFYIDNTNYIETTIGQLNFFRWAFNNNIIFYAIENYDELYNSMIIDSKKQLKKKLCQDIFRGDCILRFD